MSKIEFRRLAQLRKSRRPLGPLGCAALVACLASSCGRGPSSQPLPDGIVATVGNRVITRSMFAQALAKRGAAGNALEVRGAVLAELVDLEAAAAKAKAAGYEQRPEIQEDFKRLIVTRFRQEQLDQRTPVEPAESDILAFYQTNATRFRTPERVRCAMIYLGIPATAELDKRAAVRERAERIRVEAGKHGASESGFSLLAQQYSEDQATRYRGGDLGYLTAQELEQRLGERPTVALRNLREHGEIAPPVEGRGGLYLLKLVGRQPESQRPLAEVRDGIAYLLRRSKAAQVQREFYASCTNGLTIRINRTLLKGLSPNEHLEPPPAVPATETASVK